MNNAVLRKTMGNVGKHRDIKLVTTDKRRNQLVSEPNHHTTKWFSKNLLAIEMKKAKVKMNKSVYLQSFHNILRLLDVLQNFPFTTSETRGDYYL